MDCFSARFLSGDEIRVIRNIRNDGSFNGLEKGDLLVEQGDIGIVRGSGYFLQNQVIYQVFFPSRNRVVGIRDTEVIDAILKWVPCLFRSLDSARLTLALRVKQSVIAVKGDKVEVQRVHRNLENGQLEYEILVEKHLVKVDACVLEACSDEGEEK